MKDEKSISFLPLRPIEEELKQYFCDTKIPFPDHAITAEDFLQMLREHPPKRPFAGSLAGAGRDRELGEFMFFSEKQHASVVQHIRYLPPVIHVQEFFELECVLRGSIRCYVGDRTFTLQQGDVLVLAPDTAHAAAVLDDDGIMVNLLVRRSTFHENFLNLLPEESLLHRFFEKALYENAQTPYLLFRTAGSDLLEHRIPAILAESEKNRRYREQMLQSYVSLFLVELMRLHEKDVTVPSAEAGSSGGNVIFILQYLQNNYATLSLTDLSSFFNYSERQMQRILLAATGQTFTENIRSLRLSAVRKLLEETDLTVASAAEQAGYYDASSLRHEFRRAFGMTPQAYRALHRKGTGRSSAQETGS